MKKSSVYQSSKQIINNGGKTTHYKGTNVEIVDCTEERWNCNGEKEAQKQGNKKLYYIYYYWYSSFFLSERIF